MKHLHQLFTPFLRRLQTTFDVPRDIFFDIFGAHKNIPLFLFSVISVDFIYSGRRSTDSKKRAKVSKLDFMLQQTSINFQSMSKSLECNETIKKLVKYIILEFVMILLWNESLF